MADATTAAKQRIDRALAALERRVMDIKARSAAATVAEDDLFAAHDPAAATRIAELEAAGREASDALSRAADELRHMLSGAD
ncbi:MAG: hypothetical protein KF910_08565 [Brevundimonas sp.]|uniref:hypothetical protein n=1 Tax=Brevundimonas sp. TaxID=1871086 RepID=UPI0025B8D3D5|nr:hypothetical protein [Brevundimonas sp.]MBX3477646.1 hypothetical protein [Brevundimonas sp.]